MRKLNGQPAADAASQEAFRTPCYFLQSFCKMTMRKVGWNWSWGTRPEVVVLGLAPRKPHFWIWVRKIGLQGDRGKGALTSACAVKAWTQWKMPNNSHSSSYCSNFPFNVQMSSQPDLWTQGHKQQNTKRPGWHHLSRQLVVKNGPNKMQQINHISMKKYLLSWEICCLFPGNRSMALPCNHLYLWS